jgi:hypothetical protein
VSVTFADAEPNGLASMVGTLIEQNLARDPTRVALLRPAVVTLTAVDAGVGVTLRIGDGDLEIANGEDPHPQLDVSTDSHRLLDLASVPLRLALPDVLSARGRQVLVSLLRRRLRVRGLLRHPLLLTRLNRLLSTAGGARRPR